MIIGIFALIGVWIICVSSNKLELAKYSVVFNVIDRLSETLLPVISSLITLPLV